MTSVIIAGLGPVGGTLAALLGAQGVRTVVVEPNLRPYPKPRAAVLEIESIRLLSLIPGLAPRDEWSVPMARNGVVGPDRRPLFLLEQRAEAYGLPQIVRIDQPALESALRAAIAAMPSVEVLTGRAVQTVSQTEDEVAVTLDDGRRLTASWLVGCDGTTGTVRTQAGIPFTGDTFAQPWLVVDALTTATTETGVDGTTNGNPTVAFVLDPARPAVAMSSPGRWRWEWMLLPGEQPAAMTSDETVHELVAPWTDPDRLKIERAAVFTFHARMADHWRAGRVLLAGDAAHAMPPFAGAGLGMGIRDAGALAWRLAAAARPAAHDAAPAAKPAAPHVAEVAGLDGYERERRPDVAKTIKMALRIGRVLQTRNRAAALMFRGLTRALNAVPGLQSRLGDRPLPPRHLPRAVAGPLPRAGHVLPNPRVSVAGGPPTRLDEVIGYRWAFIGNACDPRREKAPDAVYLTLNLADPPPDCLAIEDLDGLLDPTPGTITAVRPDRFLLGTHKTS
ncbi:MAG: FAD-dependent monooxygenase [Actinoplanes sp.]